MTPFPVLAPAATIAEVVERIEAVIAWSIANGSRLGYFAALYKRITRAIGVAVEQGVFQDAARMQRFDATFANRYLAALSGYFYPGNLAPTHSWRVAFDATQLPDPIIAQHMLTAVNAHIHLDLGIAAFQTAHPLASLHDDFDAVNAVLAAQVDAVLDEIDSISPVLADIYDILQKDEIELIGEGLIGFRDSAWAFATCLALEPVFLDRPTITVRDLETAAFGSVVLKPPPGDGGVGARGREP